MMTILARSSSQVCVCDLEAAVQVKQPTVSHHLRLLREAGLTDCERQALWGLLFRPARRTGCAACPDFRAAGHAGLSVFFARCIEEYQYRGHYGAHHYCCTGG
jgi:DNA-binding transcriptional ArsR family regulator